MEGKAFHSFLISSEYCITNVDIFLVSLRNGIKMYLFWMETSSFELLDDNLYIRIKSCRFVSWLTGDMFIL